MPSPTYSEMRKALEDLEAHVIDIVMTGDSPKKTCNRLAAAAGQATSVLDEQAREYIKQIIPKDPRLEFIEAERERMQGKRGSDG